MKNNINEKELEKLVIIGASGFGREVAWLVERINEACPTWELLGFLDDNMNIQNVEINGYKVLGTIGDVGKYPDACYVCAIGSSEIRKRVIERTVSINPKIQFATLVDPSVVMSKLVEVGEGSIICAQSILTVNIKIGKHNIINLDCTIGHDVVLSDYVTLYPSVNVSGSVKAGNCVEFGTGSQIIQGISVCDYCIIGAGAVVIRNIEHSGTYVGVPARFKER